MASNVEFDFEELVEVHKALISELYIDFINKLEIKTRELKAKGENVEELLTMFDNFRSLNNVYE